MFIGLGTVAYKTASTSLHFLSTSPRVFLHPSPWLDTLSSCLNIVSQNLSHISIAVRSRPPTDMSDWGSNAGGGGGWGATPTRAYSNDARNADSFGAASDSFGAANGYSFDKPTGDSGCHKSVPEFPHPRAQSPLLTVSTAAARRVTSLANVLSPRRTRARASTVIKRGKSSGRRRRRWCRRARCRLYLNTC